MNFFFKIENLESLYRLPGGMRKFGYSFGALLHACSSDRNKIFMGINKVSNSGLLDASLRQAYYLKNEFGIKQDEKVVLIGNHSLEWLMTLVALTNLGATTYLVNPRFKKDIIESFIAGIGNPKVFIDGQSQEKLDLSEADILQMRTAVKRPNKHFLRMLAKSKSSVVNMTSGTSGQPKPGKRSLKVSPYFSVFQSVYNSLKLDKDKSILISIPCAHGYGLAALLTAIALKKNIFLAQNKQEIKEYLDSGKIDCWISLPSQLEEFVETSQDLLPKKIITGSEPIKKKLTTQILKHNIDLYNLYGTTETGVLSLATPKMLRENPETLGKPFKKVKHELRNQKGDVYELWVKSPWKMDADSDDYISTGDKIRVDDKGFWCHAGRSDQQFLSYGHLTHIESIKVLMDKHFPEFKTEVNYSDQKLRFSLFTPKEIKEKLEIEQKIQNLLPRHLVPDEVIWR